MTEHLPECPWAPHDCDEDMCERCDRGCYCNELRACEDRVLDAALGKVMAYREDKEQRGSFVHWDDLLVAIRALKEKP